MKPFEYSHVYVIESLRPNDVNTGTELFNDVIRRRMRQRGLEANCSLIIVSSKIEFFAALEMIRQVEINQLANPIIHFEMHGDETGLQVSNYEIISWEELQFFLLQLNGICGNNLFVSMATCKGGYIHKAINPSAWTPFWGFMGPFEEVTDAEILANFAPFYNEFLQSDNFNAAVAALHAANPAGYSRFRFNNTEYIFQKAYQNYEVIYLTPEMIELRLKVLFLECRPKPEFRDWTDEKLNDVLRRFIVDDKALLKKNLMRKFFMLDKFPHHAQYYPDLA
jgi:hypothetical protein